MTSTTEAAYVAATTTWTRVCRLTDIQPEVAVCAVVARRQVAVVRTHDDEIYAVSQRDPFSGAFVLSRGIVGTRTIDGVIVPVLQSPMYKQAFDVRTGHCLDDSSVQIEVYPVRVTGDVIEVGMSSECTDDP